MHHPAITIRSILPGDISKTIPLSAAEGWNQTVRDWKFLVDDQYSICLLAEEENNVVGTTTAIIYAGMIAWVGMVLVERRYRQRGIARSLLAEILDKTGRCELVKLDATAAGLPVYTKFGFCSECRIIRMTNPKVEEGGKLNYQEVRPMTALHLQEVIDMDAAVFGTGRPQLITHLFNQEPSTGFVLIREQKVAGFALGREGLRYRHVGPVTANSVDDAKLLIGAALTNFSGDPAIVDVLTKHGEIVDWMSTLGFRPQRDFIRMYKGRNACEGVQDRYFLIAGPEFG